MERLAECLYDPTCLDVGPFNSAFARQAKAGVLVEGVEQGHTSELRLNKAQEDYLDKAHFSRMQPLRIFDWELVRIFVVAETDAAGHLRRGEHVQEDLKPYRKALSAVSMLQFPLARMLVLTN